MPFNDWAIKIWVPHIEHLRIAEDNDSSQKNLSS